MSSAALTLPPRSSTTQLRGRRSPRLILIGILAMCLGGLGAAVLYQQSTTSHRVLISTRTVLRGEVIKESDLRITEIAGAPIPAVDAHRLREVVGQTALLDIAEGSIVGPSSYGQVTVNAGTSQLGLRLTAGRVPVRELPAGTPVRIIGVAAKADVTSAAPIEASVTNAVVVTSPRATPDGAAVMLDVEVPADKVVLVAQLAAAERIVVVREPVR